MKHISSSHCRVVDRLTSTSTCLRLPGPETMSLESSRKQQSLLQAQPSVLLWAEAYPEISPAHRPSLVQSQSFFLFLFPVNLWFFIFILGNLHTAHRLIMHVRITSLDRRDNSTFSKSCHRSRSRLVATIIFSFDYSLPNVSSSWSHAKRHIHQRHASAAQHLFEAGFSAALCKLGPTQRRSRVHAHR